MAIEIYEMRINVIQQSPPGHEPKHGRETTAQRFHETPMLMREPKRLQVGNEPALPASPFEGRPDPRHRSRTQRISSSRHCGIL